MATINLLDTDKLKLVSSSAANLDVLVSSIRYSSTFALDDIKNQATAISSATTTDILTAPASGKFLTVKHINIRNRHASTSCDVTVQLDRSATNYEIHKVTLLAGEALQFIEGVGWFVLKSGRTDRWMMLTGSDYVNATTSFSDITGLTCPVINGKVYNWMAMLLHVANATTTGPRFGVNGPSMTAIQAAQIIRSVTLTSVDATTVESQSAGPATAVDTSAGGATATGNVSVTAALLSGVFTAGADGTFALRGQSEVAVAAGLTVKVGSWLHVWEPTG